MFIAISNLANLKITREGEIFLLDFGLAKGAAGQMATVRTGGSVHGYTPLYAPLEQIHGQGTDPRSDIYSLGATLVRFADRTTARGCTGALLTPSKMSGLILCRRRTV